MVEYVYYPAQYEDEPLFRESVPGMYALLLGKILKNTRSMKVYDHNFFPFEIKKQYRHFLKENIGAVFDANDTRVSKSEIEVFLSNILVEASKKGILLRQLRKRYYCPSCGRLLDDHEINTVKKRMVSHEIRVSLTDSVEPLYFTVTDLSDVINVAALGVRNIEKYENRKAILPITGRQVDIFQVEALNRPELFSYHCTLVNGMEKIPATEWENKYMSGTQGDLNRLAADLKAYGAYVSGSEQELNRHTCRRCGSTVKRVLAEQFLIEGDDLQKLHEGPIYLNTYPSLNRTSVKTYRCTPEVLKSVCGEKKEKIFFDHNLMKICYPIIYDRNISHFVCSERDKDVLRDNFELFARLCRSDIKTGNWISVASEHSDVSLRQYMQQKSIRIEEIVTPLKKARQPFYMTYMHKWSQIFQNSALFQDLEIRVDFYFDKMILTHFEQFITDQQNAMETGILEDYLHNLRNIISMMNRWVYPYLKKISPSDEPEIFRNCYYIHNGIMSYIYMLLPGASSVDFPKYREDYNFTDELEKDQVVADVIDGITEGRNILGMGGNRRCNVIMVCRNGVDEEKISANRKFIKAFLNIEEISFVTEKEIARQNMLQVPIRDIDIYLPIFDKAAVVTRIQEIEVVLQQLNEAIERKRCMLFDFEFVTKADRQILEKENGAVKTLLEKKEKLISYKKRLVSLFGEENDGKK